MTLKQYLIIMSAATFIAWAIWGVVIFYFDPNQAKLTGYVLFYSSLFLALLGTFSVFGFIIKAKILKKDEIVFRHIKRTFRQGLFFSLFIIISLFLAQFKLLTWWNFSLLITFYVFLEGLLFTNRKYQNKNYV